jgi:hypothetical protein
MIGRAAGDLSKLSTNAQEIQLRKAEFGRAAADHLSEIAKKTEETRRLQKPSVKWTACAAASFVIVSLLLLAPSYDEQDDRRTAFILRGGSAKVTLTGVTKPASGEARTTEVAIIKRGIGQANSAMIEGEPAPRSAPNIIIIRGGRRESKPQ